MLCFSKPHTYQILLLINDKSGIKQKLSAANNPQKARILLIQDQTQGHNHNQLRKLQ